jgi:hypothetical protein
MGSFGGNFGRNFSTSYEVKKARDTFNKLDLFLKEYYEMTPE